MRRHHLAQCIEHHRADPVRHDSYAGPGLRLAVRLTTEIIVAQLLFNARLIDVRLFTALVAAESFTAITVFWGFALLVRRWGEQLTTPQSDI